MADMTTSFSITNPDEVLLICRLPGKPKSLFTLTLQESRMPQICGVKGEAVVLYRDPLTTKEMWYPRLSHLVNNMAVFRCFQDFTWSAF